MKIVFTVNTYYPLKDGVQFVTEYYAEGLASRGYEVVVITPRYSRLKESEVHNGVQIIRVNVFTKHAFYVGEKKAYQKLVQEECENAIALVNVCTQNATTELLFPILRNIKCKKILYMHGMHDFKWNRFNLASLPNVAHKLWNNLRWRYDYLTNGKYINAYDEVIQLHKYDQATKFFKTKYGIDSKVIENAVDTRFFTDVIDKGKKDYMINVAAYSQLKNQELIIRSYYESGVEKTRLILIGNEENKYTSFLRKLNKRLAEKYGKENRVKILVNIPRKQTIELIKNASMFIMGSQQEVFPISIIEAMAAGIPFISTNVGIVKYLPGGIIVKSEVEMAKAMYDLSSDKKEALYLGTEGRKYAEKSFNIDDKVKELERLIKD